MDGLAHAMDGRLRSSWLQLVTGYLHSRMACSRRTQSGCFECRNSETLLEFERWQKWRFRPGRNCPLDRIHDQIQPFENELPY